MTPLDAEAARRVREFERFASWCVRRFLSQYKIPAHAALDSADLHAEAVFALCRCANGWDGAQESFRAYVAKAVHNRLLSVCGFRQRSGSYPAIELISLDAQSDEGEELWGDVLLSPLTTPEEICVRQQLAQAFEEAVERLRPLHRDVIRRRLTGDSTGDIARALKRTNAQVALIERAALNSLRPALEAYRD